MKNQYFGDVNDYKKYGLLRAVIDATDLSVLVNWMLTPGDSSSDGNRIAYLQKPQEYRHHDPVLFDGLRTLVVEQGQRAVGAIENTNLLPGATYFSLSAPDAEPDRKKWFDLSMWSLGGADLLFLDPDNGLEIKSMPYGRKGSSKYLYWREVQQFWMLGKSLLIYQHFIREKRPVFIQRMMKALQEKTPGSLVKKFETPHVLFLMALQPPHQNLHAPIVDLVQERWKGRIEC